MCHPTRMFIHVHLAHICSLRAPIALKLLPTATMSLQPLLAEDSTAHSPLFRNRQTWARLAVVSTAGMCFIVMPYGSIRSSAQYETAERLKHSCRYVPVLKLTLPSHVCAGLVGPILVVLLGARIWGCPPRDGTACNSGMDSGNFTMAANTQSVMRFSQHSVLAGTHEQLHGDKPALDRFRDPAWLSGASAQLQRAWGLQDLTFLQMTG